MKSFRLGLEWFLNPDHLPLLVGLAKGWFREVDIELELVPPRDHLDAFAQLETGELDAAITEPLHLIEDRSQGRTVVGFGRFLHTNGGVMTLASSGIERPRDMRDKRAQYPGAPGPGGLAIVETMIEADGGTAGALVPVNHGFQHTRALIEGSADVATLAFYNFEVIESAHLGHPARFFALKDWAVPDFCQLVLMTLDAKLTRDEIVFRRFLEVLGRGLDFIHQHPTEARRIYFERTEADPGDPLTSAILDATLPCFCFDLGLCSEYFVGLNAWMRARKLIGRDVRPEEVWRNDLVFTRP